MQCILYSIIVTSDNQDIKKKMKKRKKKKGLLYQYWNIIHARPCDSNFQLVLLPIKPSA